MVTAVNATRAALIFVAAFVVASCAKTDQAAKDSAAAAQPAAAPAATPAAAPTLASFAGKWQVTATPVGGKDTSVTKYTMTATSDTTGWSIQFPSGTSTPLQVSLSGDSVMVKTGTFASQRRKNMKVWTNGALRLQDGKLVGSTTAHYSVAGPDSVLQLRVDGTKMP